MHKGSHFSGNKKSNVIVKQAVFYCIIRAKASAACGRVACKRRRISYCRSENKRPPEIRLCLHSSARAPNDLDHFRYFIPPITANENNVSKMAFILVCSFFVRTDSTTVLGCTPPDPYQAPVEEALPLACQPHLLHPGARREHMFGTVHEHFSGTGAAAQVNSMALSSSAARQVKSNSEVGQQSAFSNQTNAGEKVQ